MKRFLMLALLLSLPSIVGADAVKHGDSSLAGTYQCQITAFQWPHSREDPLMQNSQGTSEVVADGAGKLSEGSMSLHSVREENEGIPCKYCLRNGTYTINPDGSGRGRSSDDLLNIKALSISSRSARFSFCTRSWPPQTSTESRFEPCLRRSPIRTPIGP